MEISEATKYFIHWGEAHHAAGTCIKSSPVLFFTLQKRLSNFIYTFSNLFCRTDVIH